jgi:predicted RND superfamily exporter protein
MINKHKISITNTITFIVLLFSAYWNFHQLHELNVSKQKEKDKIIIEKYQKIENEIQLNNQVNLLVKIVLSDSLKRQNISDTLKLLTRRLYSATVKINTLNSSLDKLNGGIIDYFKRTQNMEEAIKFLELQK